MHRRWIWTDSLNIAYISISLLHLQDMKALSTLIALWAARRAASIQRHCITGIPLLNPDSGTQLSPFLTPQPPIHNGKKWQK